MVTSDTTDIQTIVLSEAKHTFFIIRKNNKREEYKYTQVEGLPPNVLLTSSYDKVHEARVLTRLGKVIDAEKDCHCGIKRDHKHCALCGKVLHIDW